MIKFRVLATSPPPPSPNRSPVQDASTPARLGGGGTRLSTSPSLRGRKGQVPGKARRGVGSKYEPTFSPLPPRLLSLAKAAATDAQQRQHSWSACKRKGDTAREGARRGLRPAPPATRSRRAPRRAPALATRPSPAGAHGGPERAAGRAHASRRAHSMVRCGRGGCGRPDAAGGAHWRRAFSPPARSAALQVRRQVGAAGAHLAARARRGLPSSGRPRALPSAGAGRRSCLPAAPGGHGGSPGPGWRAPLSADGRRTLSVPARPLARQSVRLSVRASEAPGESSASWLPQRAEPSARLSTAR